VPLDLYHAKRNFKATPEPRGRVERAAKGKKRRFIIQKHAATRLHYDFRLEHDGVLKSWAVTRGPSLDPEDKRLAVRTEDHPLAYGAFEGVIPKAEYGGGSVMLWDRGRWEPEGDPDKGLAKGHLAFTLHGDRLTGKWHLVRMQGKRKGDGKRENWLLIKAEDDAANGPDPTTRHMKSVVSGRTMEEIAAAPDAVWHSDRAADAQPSAAPKKSRGVWGGPKRKASRKAGAGEFVAPQLASAAEAAPDGARWLHEVKFDGYRLVARKTGKSVMLFTRNAYDWTDRFPGIAAALAGLAAKSALLDGEAAYVKPDGVTDFKSLQDHIDSADPAIRYFLFDLLELDGKPLLDESLTRRKDMLAALISASKPSPLLVYSEHVDGDGPSFFRAACEQGLEGIVSKRADAPYRSGRSKTWLKIKCGRRAEFVIGGFSKSSVSGRPFASLLLGTFDDGALRYAGKVGTGFTESKMAELSRLLAKRKRAASPFADIPKSATRGASWVEPDLVAEIGFTEETREGRLRHPSFQGLREDKPSRQVRKDAAPPARPARGSKNETELHGVRLTHPDKILWPDAGLTKGDLAAYYEAVLDSAAPYLFDRPISLVRCPDGAGAECFFQRHAMKGMSDAIRTVPIRDAEGKSDYLYVDGLAGLIGLVQIGALELHDWGCRVDAPEKCDRLVFDLDPDEGLDFETVKAASIEVRDFLGDLGLSSFLRASGGKGLHVVVPLSRRVSFDEAKSFSLGVAEALAAARPDRYTANLAKRARKGKLFVDYLRNQRGGTAIANFSPRARDGAPVATPLRWDELRGLGDARPFSIRTLPARLKRLKTDPWADYFSVTQSITAKAKRALGM
jgi:bifunctional non-homologous end joining protein LigD